jgi:hypothetical protein
MSLRSLNRRLDRLEQRLPMRHAKIWDYFLGLASFDDLDEDTRERLRKAEADCRTNPLDELENAINAPLITLDGRRPRRSEASAEMRSELT